MRGPQHGCAPSRARRLLGSSRLSGESAAELGNRPLMPRPGAVIEVDRNTPPVLFHFGQGIRLERLPLGARIVYPPDPLEAIAHPERAIKRALANPLVDAPLKSLLRRGMK